MSSSWDDFLLRVDVAGVVAMIAGSYAVGMHNGFFCYPWLQGAAPGRWRRVLSLLLMVGVQLATYQ
jgi:hypothetical protein